MKINKIILFLFAVVMILGSFGTVFAEENITSNENALMVTSPIQPDKSAVKNPIDIQTKDVVQAATSSTTAPLIQAKAVTYTVTFMTHSKVYKTVVVEENQCVTRPSDPQRVYYPDKFEDFYSWVDANNRTFDFNTPITGNITLYATYSVGSIHPLPTYIVTFNSNGGSKVASQAVSSGNAVKKPKDPTKAGRYFVGWYTKDGKKWDFAKPVGGDMTLSAHWSDYSPSTSDPGFPLLPLSLLCGIGVVGTIYTKRQRQ